MKVQFQFYSKKARPNAPHIPMSFTREVNALPRIGDHIVHHTEGQSTISLVRAITPVFEDRDRYKNTEDGDAVIVTMQTVSRDKYSVVFDELIAAAE